MNDNHGRTILILVGIARGFRNVEICFFFSGVVWQVSHITNDRERYVLSRSYKISGSCWSFH